VTLHRPNSELVAVAWVRGVPGIPAGAVGTTLPGDSNAWPDGFVQIGVVGGSPGRDVPERRPVLQLDFWAAGGSRPAWGRANQLAERIVEHCYSSTVSAATPVQRFVALPAGYLGARVQTAEVLREPRRLPADEARYARYSLDLLLTWVEVAA